MTKKNITTFIMASLISALGSRKDFFPGNFQANYYPAKKYCRHVYLQSVGKCGYTGPVGSNPSILLLSILEFVLGGFIAISKVCERTFLQTIVPSAHLGKIGSLRQALQISVKLLSVPLVVVVVKWFEMILVSIGLTLCYVLAAICLVNKGDQQKLMKEVKHLFRRHS
ncbi:hypothetical protein ACFSO0_09700 [Brevibacillus sp. GCM10020057]|uniref:hypothetical protein n=1 Tax=Brevibacillus sp. GCM10020057 TaxID=3317327 RepID=UPI00363E98B7